MPLPGVEEILCERTVWHMWGLEKALENSSVYSYSVFVAGRRENLLFKLVLVPTQCGQTRAMIGPIIF